MNCPLCFAEHGSLYTKDKYRTFYLCLKCDLVFVDKQNLLTSEQEKNRYDFHQNNPDDDHYKNYFKNIIDLFKDLLPIKGLGLDLGCGRTTLMSELMTNDGFKTVAYDPYYFPAKHLLTDSYDWIMLCEVFEHTKDPKNMVDWILNHLNKNGLWIVSMAERPKTKELFDRWYYKNDQKHYHFWSEKTWEYLTKTFHLLLEKRSDSLFVLKKLISN